MISNEDREKLINFGIVISIIGVLLMGFHFLYKISMVETEGTVVELNIAPEGNGVWVQYSEENGSIYNYEHSGNYNIGDKVKTEYSKIIPGHGREYDSNPWGTPMILIVLGIVITITTSLWKGD